MAAAEERSTLMGPIGAERCSITAAMGVLGDSWSILVLRDLFFGVQRFNDLQRDLGISRSVLTDRLAKLVDGGIVRTVPYQEPGERVRDEYHLTDKGFALLPVMAALMEWADEHLRGGEGPTGLHEVATGDDVRLELRTTAGRTVQPREVAAHLRRRRAAS